MAFAGARTSRAAAVLAALGGAAGCAATQSPLPPDAFVRKELPPPKLPPPPAPEPLPAPPPEPPPASAAPLPLSEVLASVEAHFPLLLAVEQEREIAAGQRLSAEGGFDPILRLRGSDQNGTFSNGRLDAGIEQPLANGGASTFAGWRLGKGNFPVYYGDRKTADGGEFRAGGTLPLLQNRDIDPRRARVRAAQIQEKLADPVVRRARLDFFRNAAQAYWAWQAAGAQYRIAATLVELGEDRQEVVDVRQKEKLISLSAPALNRRLVAARREALLAAERQLQAAAVRLSLFTRDGNGDPVTPPATRLMAEFPDLQPPPPDAARLADDVAAALNLRPELTRFQLEKERRTVELTLAANQELPALNLFGAVAQDVGFSKKSSIQDGQFKTDRTNAEVGASFELPLPRRDARGRIRTAQAQLTQLLAQERFARDDVAAQVRDAVSELTQTYARLGQAREELREANRVLEIETALFRNQQTSLFELNLQEIAAAEARVKVVTVLGLYYAALANYRAALGLDGPDAPPVVIPPKPPAEALPPPRRVVP